MTYRVPGRLREPTHGERTDVELLELLSQGEVEAASTLYGRHATLLVGSALRIVRDWHEAQDVAHDAFLQVSERAVQYSAARGSVVAWLLTITRNLSVDRVRRNARRGALLRRVVEEPRLTPRNPEEIVSNDMSCGQIRAALARLPEARRTTLEGMFFEGLTLFQIAERERVPLGTVKSRAARALASMRCILRERPSDALKNPSTAKIRA